MYYNALFIFKIQTILLEKGRDEPYYKIVNMSIQLAVKKVYKGTNSFNYLSTIFSISSVVVLDKVHCTLFSSFKTKFDE